MTSDECGTNARPSAYPAEVTMQSTFACISASVVARRAPAVVMNLPTHGPSPHYASWRHPATHRLRLATPGWTAPIRSLSTLPETAGYAHVRASPSSKTRSHKATLATVVPAPLTASDEPDHRERATGNRYPWGVEFPGPVRGKCSKTHTMQTGHLAGHPHICHEPPGHEDMHCCGSCGHLWVTRPMLPVP